MYIVPQAERRVKAKDRPYHYVYKITNLVNGNIYVGMRSSIFKPEEDIKYMGSSVTVEAAIEKHGLENFKKEIVQSFPTREEAFALEGEIVNSEFVSRKDTYNHKVGGQGVGCGEDHPRFGVEITKEHKKKLNQGSVDFWKNLSDEERESRANNAREHQKNLWQDPEYRERQMKRMTETPPMSGKSHSEESRSRMSESAKNRSPIICPHCQKAGYSGVMYRWHFDNCRNKLE